jgi:hypothetical protein
MKLSGLESVEVAATLEDEVSAGASPLSGAPIFGHADSVESSGREMSSADPNCGAGTTKRRDNPNAETMALPGFERSTAIVSLRDEKFW